MFVKSKKKIALIITSKIFERNYLNQYFLDSCDEVELIVIKRMASTSRFELDSNSLLYSLSGIQNLISKILFKIELIRKLNKSKTFKFRLLRSIYWPEIKILIWGIKDGNYEKNFDNIISLTKLVGKSVIVATSYIMLLPITLLPKSIYRPIIRATEGELGRLLKNLNPNIIIFPFTGYEIEQNYLPSIAKEINSKLVFCTDNWDNLSSKTVISFQPDIITAWGDQTKRHAMEIQGIPKEKIIVAPSPRLAVYKNTLPIKERKYVIGFVGAFLSFDEIDALEIIEQILNKRFAETGESWSISYRPHPWRMAKSEWERLANLKRVNIANEFENNYINNSWSTDFQPSLSGYPDFFEKCDFIVGGLTTMLLEAMLSKRRVIAIGYWDKKYNLYSPGAAYENYEHFVGLSKLKNISLAETKDIYRKLIWDEISMSKSFHDDEEIIKFIDSKKYLSISILTNIGRQ